jgi:hypothetical protein
MAEEGKGNRLTITVSFAELPQLHSEIHDTATAFRVNAPAVVMGILEQFAGKVSGAYGDAEIQRIEKIKASK